MREFRRASEAAIARIETRDDRFHHTVDNRGVEHARRACKTFRARHRARKRLRGFIDFFAARAKRFGHGRENAAETGPAARIVGRKIRAAEKRAPIGQKKSGERPAALSGNGADAV